MVIVYVDDFKVSAPESLSGIKDNMKEVWGKIRKHIEMSDPEPPGRFLGCMRRLTTKPCAEAPGGKIQVMEYDMQDQLQSSVDLYLEIVGTSRPLRQVATPLRNVGNKNVAAQPVAEGPWLRCPWCKGEFDERTFVSQEGQER